jgi:hypothetical protein
MTILAMKRKELKGNLGYVSHRGNYEFIPFHARVFVRRRCQNFISVYIALLKSSFMISSLAAWRL